jgi:hypothetical protein
MAYMTYFALVKPYTSKKANEWEIFNEIFVVLISYTLMFLSQYDDDIEIRSLIGRVYVGLISLNISCNAYKIFKNIIYESIPEGYKNYLSNNQTKNDERRLKQWIDDKVKFCEENPEIQMTNEIHQIAEITQYLQENGKLIKIQKE